MGIEGDMGRRGYGSKGTWGLKGTWVEGVMDRGDMGLRGHGLKRTYRGEDGMKSYYDCYIFFILLQQWPLVSILFADLVGFTPMCMRLTPMEVVCLLNAIYIIFDELCEKHYVYKVSVYDQCI